MPTRCGPLFGELIGKSVDVSFLLILPFYSHGRGRYPGRAQRLRQLLLQLSSDLGGLDIGDDVMIGSERSVLITSGHPIEPSRRRAGVTSHRPDRHRAECVDQGRGEDHRRRHGGGKLGRRGGIGGHSGTFRPTRLWAAIRPGLSVRSWNRRSRARAVRPRPPPPLRGPRPARAGVRARLFETKKGRPGVAGRPLTRRPHGRRAGALRRGETPPRRRPAWCGDQSSMASSEGPTSSSSTTLPAFLRTAVSISSARSGLALRNSRTLSRPWPMRWLL